MAEKTERSEKPRKKRGLVGRLVGIIIVLLLIIFVLLFFFGKNFGFDLGGMLGYHGNVSEITTTVTDENPASGEADASSQATGEATGTGSVAGSITIKVSEDKVFVGDKEVTDAAGLAELLSGLGENTAVEIEDDDAIKSTYDWVVETVGAAGIKVAE